MKYSTIDTTRKLFVTFMGNLRDLLWYDCGIKPSEKEICLLMKDVCACLNEKDYLFSDISLKMLDTLVVSETISATDTKGNPIEEMEMLLREHYNPKMMAKAIENANIIYVSYSDVAGNPVKNQVSQMTAKKLLNL